MARPTKLDDITRKLILDAIQAGATQKDAFEAAGVGESTFYAWMASTSSRYREFQEAVTRAHARGRVEKVAILALAAQKGEWKAALAWLEHRGGDEWAPVQKQQISGPEGGPIQVEGRVLSLDLDKLPPEAVAAIVKQLEDGDYDSEAGDRKSLPAPRADPSADSG